jgi:hypothetical protein
MLLLMQNIAISAGVGLALAGLALVQRKLGRYGRVMDGRTTSSRIRRSRRIKQAQGEAEEGAGPREPATREMRGFGKG